MENCWAHGSLLLSGNHFESFYDRQFIFVNCYGSSVSHMTAYIFRLSFRCTLARPRFSTLSGVRDVHVVKSYHVISSVLWCQLLFLRKNVIRFVSTPNYFVGGLCCYVSYLWCIRYTGVQHDFMLSEFLFFYPHVCTDAGLFHFRTRAFKVV